jgi:hypothetical protein
VRYAAFRKLSKGLAGGSFTIEHGSDDVRLISKSDDFTWTRIVNDTKIHSKPVKKLGFVESSYLRHDEMLGSGKAWHRIVRSQVVAIHKPA